MFHGETQPATLTAHVCGVSVSDNSPLVEANDECGPSGTLFQTLHADSVRFGARANFRVLTHE